MLYSSDIENFLKKEVRKIKIPVIVEGKQDKKVLEGLGFRKVFPISGKALPEVVEEISKRGWKEVIILTDFDEEGREKFRILRRLLQAKKVKIDEKIRQKVKFLFRVGKIEELKFYL